MSEYLFRKWKHEQSFSSNKLQKTNVNNETDN